MSRKLLLEGRTGEVAIVDDADYDWLRKDTWHLHQHGAGYACRSTLGPDGKKHCVGMQRVIMDAPSDKWVDHINGDSLDNRRANLRFCTLAENVRNQKPHKGKGLKGIKVRRGSISAQICVDRKSIYLGVFPTEAAAAKAYDEAAREYHGEFARLNFPDAKAVA